MKLLVVSWFYPPIVGGTENIARAGADDLAARGHEVTVLTSAPVGGEVREERCASGTRILRWPRLHPQNDDAVAASQLGDRLASFLEIRPFDLVHAHLLTYPLAPRRSEVLLDGFQARGLPVVDQLHGGTYERDPEATVRLVPRPDFLISDSEHVARRVRAFFDPSHPWVPAGGVDLPQIQVLYPSILTPQFVPDEALREATRRQLGWGSGDVVVFFPSRFFDIDGSLSVAKRPLVALDAFSEMVARSSGRGRAVLLAVLPPGFSGRNREEEARRAVVSQVAARGCTDRVRFLDRAVPHGEMAQLFRAADLVLVPSLEGFGLVYLEAMACGTPVVGVGEGAAPEVVGAEGGILVPPADSDTELATRLGTALARLGADPITRRRLGEGALRRVRENHDRTNWSIALEGVLQRVLNKAGSSP